ncbi:MAG: hypothetical protein KC474_06195 [Cyanobacteria bacterium HKST-UBA04]|nr:hypothetical protein [Cyanobacteria bacterium HKST-UBA04]
MSHNTHQITLSNSGVQGRANSVRSSQVTYSRTEVPRANVVNDLLLGPRVVWSRSVTPTGTSNNVGNLNLATNGSGDETAIQLQAGFGSRSVANGDTHQAFQITLGLGDSLPSITQANGRPLNYLRVPSRAVPVNLGVVPGLGAQRFRIDEIYDVDTDGDGTPDITIQRQGQTQINMGARPNLPNPFLNPSSSFMVQNASVGTAETAAS